MQVKPRDVPTPIAVVLMVVGCSIVALSALSASEGATLGVSMLLTPLLGASIAILVLLAALRGHGRSELRTRVMVLGLVVAAVGAIQLIQLWNDGLGLHALGIATSLVALTLLGLASVVLGRRLPMVGADHDLMLISTLRP
jgi:hypothetical protein